MPFSISYYSPTVQKVQNSQFYYLLSALSLFAGIIVPEPDPGKGYGSMRIGIRNTGYLNVVIVSGEESEEGPEGDV